jgi:hypothetical protein
VSSGPNKRRIAAFAAGGVGLAAIGVGTGFGISALDKSHAAKAVCSRESCTDPQGVKLSHDAVTFATVSDVALGVGIVALGVGAYLFFTGNTADPKPATVGILPVVGRDVAGLAVQGGF